MCNACICGGIKRWSEPVLAHQFFNDTKPETKILTRCCYCYQRADEAMVKYSIHDPTNDADMGNWVGSVIDISCAPGTGCDKRPSRKNGSALREMCSRMHDYD